MTCGRQPARATTAAGLTWRIDASTARPPSTCSALAASRRPRGLLFCLARFVRPLWGWWAGKELVLVILHVYVCMCCVDICTRVDGMCLLLAPFYAHDAHAACSRRESTRHLYSICNACGTNVRLVKPTSQQKITKWSASSTCTHTHTCSFVSVTTRLSVPEGLV